MVLEGPVLWPYPTGCENRCPENDKMCDEAVLFMQNVFLGPRSDMDEIVETVRKIHAHASEITRA